MPWYVLLIIALICIAVVLAFLVWLGMKGWRVAKHAAAVSGRVTPLVEGLGRRSDEITRAADRLSADGQQLATSLERMQRSLARLQVVAAAVRDALRPYLIISGWLSGESEWGDLDL
jgi:uncharacterized protein YoxC